MKNLTIAAAVALGVATSLGFISGYLFHAGFGEARSVAAQAIFEARETQRILQAYEPILITSKFYEELKDVKTIHDASELRQKYQAATLKNIAVFESQVAQLDLPKDRALAAPFLEKAAAIRKALVQIIEKTKQPETKLECTEKGGKWILFPMGQFYFCAINTSDKGKACSDDKECQGDCVPSEVKSKSPGVCAPTLPMPDGCSKHLIDGKPISEPCI